MIQSMIESNPSNIIKLEGRSYSHQKSFYPVSIAPPFYHDLYSISKHFIPKATNHTGTKKRNNSDQNATVLQFKI